METSKDSPMLSCADCGLKGCRTQDKQYPPFCPTKNMQEALRKDAMNCLQGEDHDVALASALVEYEGYGAWCRVEDTIAFARRMHVTRIGVATCIGLLKEANLLTQVLRARGFEVYTVSCKVGATAKTELEIPDCCNVCGVNICNPVLQAKILNQHHTQLNIVFGLCVGHDSLFYKHSDALCTTLVAKDRVTGHNPLVPLYQLQSYYKRLMEEPVPIRRVPGEEESV